MRLKQGDISIDHEFDEFFEGSLWLPAENLSRLAGVADEEVYLRGTKITRVVGYVFSPIESGMSERRFEELLDRMGFSRGDYVIVGLVLLEHQPHGFDVFFGVAPIAFGVEISEIKFVLKSCENMSDGAGDFARDKPFAPSRGFVVKKNPVTGVETVSFAVIHRGPIGRDFSDGIGAARVEGGAFALGSFVDFAVYLAGGGLVKARLQARAPNGFQQAEGAGGVNIHRVLRIIEADANVALGAKVIEFVGFDINDQACEGGGISEVAVVKEKTSFAQLWVGPDIIETSAVEGAGSADNAMDFVALSQEEFRKVGAILAGDAGNESFLGHK